MDRKNTAIDAPPVDVGSVTDVWIGAGETQNFAFLLMVCQTFQTKMMEYYKAGMGLDQRTGRLRNICTALKEIYFDADDRKYTIALTPGPDGALGCPYGEKDVDGVCMDTR
jgi:hypothetical protein